MPLQRIFRKVISIFNRLSQKLCSFVLSFKIIAVLALSLLTLLFAVNGYPSLVEVPKYILFEFARGSAIFFTFNHTLVRGIISCYIKFNVRVDHGSGRESSPNAFLKRTFSVISGFSAIYASFLRPFTHAEPGSDDEGTYVEYDPETDGEQVQLSDSPVRENSPRSSPVEPQKESKVEESKGGCRDESSREYPNKPSTFVGEVAYTVASSFHLVDRFDSHGRQDNRSQTSRSIEMHNENAGTDTATFRHDTDVRVDEKIGLYAIANESKNVVIGEFNESGKALYQATLASSTLLNVDKSASKAESPHSYPNKAWDKDSYFGEKYEEREDGRKAEKSPK